MSARNSELELELEREKTTASEYATKFSLVHSQSIELGEGIECLQDLVRLKDREIQELAFKARGTDNSTCATRWKPPVIVTKALRTASVYYGRDVSYKGRKYPSPYVLTIASFYSDMTCFQTDGSLFAGLNDVSLHAHSMSCDKAIRTRGDLVTSSEWDDQIFTKRLTGAVLMACAENRSLSNIVMTIEIGTVNSPHEKCALLDAQRYLRTEHDPDTIRKTAESMFEAP